MQPNAFEALGLPVRYGLPRSEVERAYHARIIAAHPDLASGGSGDGSLLDPRTLNEARQTLLNDESRARAVLGIRAPGVAAPPLTPEFLAQILGVREQAEAAIEGGDTGEISRWREWADRQRQELSESFAALVDECDNGLPTAKATQAAGVLQRWRYIERMLEQVGVPAPAPDA